jgi:hypothetical protein
MFDPITMETQPGPLKVFAEWVMFNTTVKTIGQLAPTQAVIWLHAGGFTASNKEYSRGMAAMISKSCDTFFFENSFHSLLDSD